MVEPGGDKDWKVIKWNANIYLGRQAYIFFFLQDFPTQR